MTISIEIETPLQDDVRWLIDGLNNYLTPLSPPQYQYKLTAEEMAEADMLVFVAREKTGHAVGLGALKTHSKKLGEVKRMFTLPDVRGKRVGRGLLNAIEEQAKNMNISQLVLETGKGEDFVGAWRLYQGGGFRSCGPVLDYPETPYSAFFEKQLLL